MMTLWSLSHFCAGEIKILIVQYAVITEQTCSPQAFSHFPRAESAMQFPLFLSSSSQCIFPILAPSLFLFGATFTRIAEVVQVRAASPALRDWTSFQGGSFACWSKRERSFSRMELE
jgi:hypothetical protein